MTIPKNLLIIRTDRIGDVVLSLPLAGLVKKHYPGTKVSFMVKSYTKALVENHPFINDVIILEESSGKVPFRVNQKIVSAGNYDSAVLVYPTLKTALILFFSGIADRIGTGYRWYSFMFNRKVYTHRKYAAKHELEFNVELLKKFGINEKLTPGNAEFGLKADSIVKQQILEEIKKAGIGFDKPIVIIHPGSGGSAVDYPIDKMQELTKLIDSDLDVDIIITGGTGEENLCGKLLVSPKIVSFAGKLNLSEMIALIDLSDIFVSNSTGPIHIAAALGKYTVGFYPNLLACSAKRWEPYTDKKVIFVPENDCDDCDREQCGSQDCMSSINPSRVLLEIRNICDLISEKQSK
jgi:ADP-heptose:LPS heptosyltransferase